MTRYLFRLLPLLIVGTASCEDTPSRAGETKPLRLFVFPREVEPLGQATVAVEVEACEGACTVCLRVQREGATAALLGPPGVPLAKDSGLVAIPGQEESLLASMVYVAPTGEGSEVIAATLFEGTRCSGDILDTTTARVVIRNEGVEQPKPPNDGGLADAASRQPLLDAQGADADAQGASD